MPTKIQIPYYKTKIKKLNSIERSYIMYLCYSEPEKQIYKLFHEFEYEKQLMQILTFLVEHGSVSFVDDEHTNDSIILIRELLSIAKNGDRFTIAPFKKAIKEALRINHMSNDLYYNRLKADLPQFMSKLHNTLHALPNINYQQYINIQKAKIAKLKQGQDADEPEAEPDSPDYDYSDDE